LSSQKVNKKDLTAKTHSASYLGFTQIRLLADSQIRDLLIDALRLRKLVTTFFKGAEG
jgi:hypothetical protein